MSGCFTCTRADNTLFSMTTVYWEILNSLLSPDVNINHLNCANKALQLCEECMKLLNSISEFRIMAAECVLQQAQYWNGNEDIKPCSIVVEIDEIDIKQERVSPIPDGPDINQEKLPVDTLTTNSPECITRDVKIEHQDDCDLEDTKPMEDYSEAMEPDPLIQEKPTKLKKKDKKKGKHAKTGIRMNMDDDRMKRKNRSYNEATLKSAIENILESNMTLYKASQEFGIAWTTLKRNVERVKEEQARGLTQVSMLKIGRPFSLPQNKELELVQYIIKMQELGFDLTVNRIREIAFELAQAEDSASLFNNEKKVAGWSWWISFKNRYGLSLGQSENLSTGRAACSSSVVLNDFYEKLEKVFKDHDLMDSPQRIWNCDETGLMYVLKPEKIETQIGKKYIYNRSYAKKGTTTTMLACINAAGCYIPPLVIFKGKRNFAPLQDGALPNSMTRLSPKGWMNADLFLEWLKFFDENIPPARPVFLIMDSQASHITPQVLEYAKSHQIVLFAMPAHTSHVLQPLDVGVFRPLKAAWRTELEKYKREYPKLIPTRYDFHKLLTPAYEKAFSQANIRAGFKKTGIYPFNNGVIPAEVIAPSQVTDKPAPTEQLQEDLVNEDLDLVIPRVKATLGTISP